MNKSSGPSFQYKEGGRIKSLAESNAFAKARLCTQWEIKLVSKTKETHPGVNGGKPFWYARYQRNVSSTDTPSPEHFFEVWKTLRHEDALVIKVETNDLKECSQYSQGDVDAFYEVFVEGYSKSVEDLVGDSLSSVSK